MTFRSLIGAVARRIGIVAAVAMLGVPVAGASITMNGGFETGDFTNWTTGGNDGIFVGVDNVAPHSGVFGAFFGPQETSATLTQSLLTNPGETYTLSFWLANDSGGANFFAVYWDGVQLDSMVDQNQFPYTLFTYTGLLATGASSSLQFEFINEDAYWEIDDISVDGAPSQVPEPSAFSMLALGAAGLLLGSRKFRRLR